MDATDYPLSNNPAYQDDLNEKCEQCGEPCEGKYCSKQCHDVDYADYYRESHEK